MNEYQESLLERILKELQIIRLNTPCEKINKHIDLENISNKMKDIEKENEEILKTW